MTTFFLTRAPNVSLSATVATSVDVNFSGLPAWRTAMTATNTLYEVGLTPAASGIDAAWTYPSGSLPSRWGDSTYERTKHAGYGGCAFLPGVGAWGTWVYGGTGEGVWENNTAQWRMSEETPDFTPWQQATYHLTSAAATSAGDDVYYSPTDAANTAIVAAARRFGGADNIGSLWDRGFPMSYDDWVWRRKQQGWTLKDNQPHFWRYNTPRTVPAALSGLGVDCIAIKETILHGPFPQAWRPSGGGLVDGDFHTDLHASGRRKYYGFYQRSDTKAWVRLASVVPDCAVIDSFADHCVLDTANKRLYYLVSTATGFQTYHLDIASGIASATFSALSAAATGGSARPEFDRTNVVMTDGHPTGKRYVYFRSTGGAEQFGMLDLDTNVVTNLNLATAGMSAGSNLIMALDYVASENRIIITSTYLNETPKLHTFIVPSDPTKIANYTVANHTLSLASGVSVENIAHFSNGQRGLYHAGLGVIIVTQKQNKMLAYRPAW